MLNAKSVEDLLGMLVENEVEFVDFRFTDMFGKVHHTTKFANCLDADVFIAGVMFDGSSITGWREVNESDMIMMPDFTTAFLDPFTANKTAVVFCSIFDPKTLTPYERDPRNIGEKAENYLTSSGMGDVAYFGPELEFFMFDDVKFQTGMYGSSYSLDSNEFPVNNGKSDKNIPNLSHRPAVKGGYFPTSPVDTCDNLRADMVKIMHEIGVEPELLHHEVAPAQHEIGFKFDTLVKCAEKAQKYKYVVQNVAESYGKTATFMPKPVFGDNGSGMHVHQSIWRNGKNTFFGNEYAQLSETALYYIGGIIKHAKALNAFTNPSTNSYKRLVPGYEAPVLLAYSAMNRSASIRIPYNSGEKAKRIEVRFPDPVANPYLSFAAMLMAGLDGIRNKIHPGEAQSANLYDLSKEEQRKIPSVCGSLAEALDALEADFNFLLEGGVFTKDMLDAYIAVKREEVDRLRLMPHPVEFEMYYSC